MGDEYLAKTLLSKERKRQNLITNHHGVLAMTVLDAGNTSEDSEHL